MSERGSEKSEFSRSIKVLPQIDSAELPASPTARLDAELLLGLQRLEPGRFLVHVRIDQPARARAQARRALAQGDLFETAASAIPLLLALICYLLLESQAKKLRAKNEAAM